MSIERQKPSPEVLQAIRESLMAPPDVKERRGDDVKTANHRGAGNGDKLCRVEAPRGQIRPSSRTNG